MTTIYLHAARLLIQYGQAKSAHVVLCRALSRCSRKRDARKGKVLAALSYVRRIP